MFESAILRKHGQAFTSVDPGVLAETLLFYSNVHIVAHYGALIEILKVLGPDMLLRLINEEIITFTYLRTDFGTVSVNKNGMVHNGFISMRLDKTEKDKKKLTSEELVQLAFERALGKSWSHHRMAKHFIEKISVKQDIPVAGQAKGVPGLAFADLADAFYVQEAIRNSIIGLIPSYVPPDNFHFGVLRSESDFLIDTNIDFSTLNVQFKALYPSSDVTLTPELLVGHLLEARVDLQLASSYMAEIVTSPATMPIIRQKVSALVEKRDKNLSEIELFQETSLHGARAIREAINSGEHSFDDFLCLLAKAKKFKDWLRTRNPDGRLLNEYYKAVTAESWIEKLPSKGIRFVLASGLSVALDAAFPSGFGMVAGLGLEAADTFLLDRLFRGWRPNQFVEGPLQKFGL